MPRKVYSSTSPIRHRGKLEEVLAARMPPDLAKEAAMLANTEWVSRFGRFRELYAEVKNEVMKAFPDFPRGLLGMLRSYALKAAKEAARGGDLDALAADYNRKTGIPLQVLQLVNSIVKARPFPF